MSDGQWRWDWSELAQDRWAGLPVDPVICSSDSSQSSESSGSSSSLLPAAFASPRPVVQWDGPVHPRYFKDYPFVETVAGGDQIGGSTIAGSGAFTFRADLALIPSIGGLTWSFGVNYLRNPEPGSSSSSSSLSSSSCSPSSPLLGPNFSFPQDVLMNVPAGPVFSPVLSTGEFTAELFHALAGGTYAFGSISRSMIAPSGGDFMLTSSDGTVSTYYGSGDPTRPAGRLKSISDRYGNSQLYDWSLLNCVGVLNTVTDGYGRKIQYTYGLVAGQVRLMLITDFLGRQINFQYDSLGRLEVVIGPSVNTGASNPTGGGTNTFPNGLAYVFRYDGSGRIAKIFFPKEVQATPGAFDGPRHVDVSVFDASGAAANARIKVNYNSSDQVSTEEVGNAATGVGGIYRFSYINYETTPLANPFDPSDPIVRLTDVTDRNGNQSALYFNAIGMTVFHQAFSNRGKCSLEPFEYNTYSSFNAQNQPLAVQHPAGNLQLNVYYNGVIPGLPDIYVPARGLLKSTTAVADGIRGGSGPAGGVQTQLQTVHVYEPIFNQLAAVIEPRGNPINSAGDLFPPQNGFGASASRYATINFFDYQEDSAHNVENDTALQSLLNLTSAQIGALLANASAQMAAAGLSGFGMGLGDKNGDGVTTSHLGSRVFVQHPAVTLAGSGSVGNQVRSEVFTVNYRGQNSTHTDPEGNVEVFVRFPFNKPDGVNTTSGQSSVEQYGWIKETHVDVDSGSGGSNVLALVGTAVYGDLSSFTLMITPNTSVQPNPPGLDLVTAIGSYDRLGNPLSVTNPRGFTTYTNRNELGEPYQIQAAAPYDYLRELLYDANRNLTDELIEDQIPYLDDKHQFSPGGTGSEAEVPSISGPGGLVAGKFWNHTDYDLLDDKTDVQIDATGSSSTPLITAFQRDANQNVTLVTKPKGNIEEYDFDERDLKIAQRIGWDEETGEPGAVTIWAHDLNGNVVSQIGPAQRGSSSQSLTATIADAFGGGVPLTHTGDYVKQVGYDGFDRDLMVTDAVGGIGKKVYDPGSRVIQKMASGTTGGASPTDRSGSANVLLASAEIHFDEAGRDYETQKFVFLPPTLPSGRTITQIGGGLATNSTANDHTGSVILGSIFSTYVLSRNVFDRIGRVYQVLMDNTGAYTNQFDGASRKIYVTDPMGNELQLEYDDNGNVIHTKRTDVPPDDGGNIETFETRAWHDALDRVVVTAMQGKDASAIPTDMPVDYTIETLFTVTGYDSRSNATVLIDAKQNVTQGVLDGASRSLSNTQWFFTNGDGSNALSGNSVTTTRTLDGNGLVASVKDGNGNVTGFGFDTLDRTILITLPDGSTRATQYNEASDVKVYTDELGTTFTNGLDAMGRVTGITLGGTSTDGTTSQGFQFDGLSRPTQGVDTGDLIITVNLFHDSISRNVEEEHIFGGNTRHVTNTEFTSLPSSQVTYAEPQNRVVESFYDMLYRRNVVSDAGGTPIADWRFYGAARIADFTFGNGIIGSHLNKAGSDSAVQASASNPPWGDACSDRLGYDGTGRTIGKRYSLTCGSSSSSSSLSSSSLSSGSSSFSSFSSHSSILSGSSGRPSASGGSSGSGGSAASGGLSSASSLSSPSSGSSQSSGSCSSSSSGCDCVSPLVYCQLMAGFTADHDKNSNKFFERHLHAECRSFLYPHSDPVGWANDSANRLLQFQRGIIHSDGNSIDTHLALQGVDNQRQYNLDATGNWVDGGFSGSAPAVENNHDCHPDQQNRTANNLNQIATVDGTPLSYDRTGNLLGYKDLAFTFDGFKRLIGADGTGPDGTDTDASYYYDAFRRRMRKVNNDTTMDFVPMGSQVLEERDRDNTLLRQFVWGQYVDELVQQREFENAPPGQTSADWYPLTDLLYRSVALTDDSVCQDTGGTSGSSAGPFMPSFVEVYDTDVYGRTNIYKDPGPDGVWFSDDDTPTFHPKCRRIYTGREYEPETGLHFFNSRYYEPDLGRFLSRDPIFYQGGMNLYQYVGGRPGSAKDPSGTQSEPPQGTGTAYDLTTLQGQQRLIDRYFRPYGNWGGTGGFFGHETGYLSHTKFEVQLYFSAGRDVGPIVNAIYADLKSFRLFNPGNVASVRVVPSSWVPRAPGNAFDVAWFHIHWFADPRRPAVL
jgi:RHS repeat-associated protein